MRQSLKENERLAAERRGQTLLRYQHWEDGKGGEQVSTYIRQVLVGVGFQENKLNDSPAGASHPACREIVEVVLGGWAMACLPNNSRVFRCQNEIEYSLRVSTLIAARQSCQSG